MEKERIDDSLDLKGVSCPINFVKTKVKLEEMQNVPRSIKEEGHKIVKVEKLSDASFRLLIQKRGGKNGG